MAKKIIKNLFFVSCCCLCFIFGNFLATISVDLEQCRPKPTEAKLVSSQISNQKWNEKSGTPQKSAFLIILIISSPRNHALRETIRDTWLSSKMPNIKHYFVIGSVHLPEQVKTALKYEQRMYEDILFLDNLLDSYQSLTKKVLASFIYSHSNYAFSFLMKVDDDTYVNLSEVSKFLKDPPHKERLYWGFFDGRAKPFRTTKWKETEWVICDRYIPYALGGGYVLSYDLVSFIANNHLYLKLYNSEDVSVGSWLASLDVHRVHDIRFDTEYKSKGCNNKFIVSHKQGVQEMKQKFNSMRKTGKLCVKEFQVMKTYEYNWNVSPSMCCERNLSL